MTNINDRIKELIADLGLSKNQFAIKIKTSSAMVSKITNQQTNFGKDILEKILIEYPDLNTTWLLTGVGEMWNNRRPFIITKVNEPNTVDKSYVDNNAPFHLERRMMSKVEAELAKETNERSQIYKDINVVLNFQDVITKLDQYYFENIDRMFYEILSNYKGKKFDFDKYKSDIYNEIDKVMPFAPHLANLAQAIRDFYSDVQAVDSKQVIKW